MDKTLAEKSIISNRYQIVRRIGHGGMGAIYEATDLRLQTTVALKLRTAVVDEMYRRAFEREARILARLRHPGLPIVSDHFFDGEDQFLVMEFVDGPNLYELLHERRAPLDEAEALLIADQLLEILTYLHSYSPPIIHRDIKPQNIKFNPETNRVVLLDFGLAKRSVAVNSPTLAVASVFGYTPNYAPPEQVNNTGTDQRSDLYSLGATIYHLLTGALPSSAYDRMSAALNNMPDTLRPAHVLNPRIGQDVSAVLATSMSLGAGQRYPDAQSMRAALRATAAGQRVWPAAPASLPGSETQPGRPFVPTLPAGQPPRPEPANNASTQPTPAVVAPDSVAVPPQDRSQRLLLAIIGAVAALTLICGVSAAFAVMPNLPGMLASATPTFTASPPPTATASASVAPSRTPRATRTATPSPSRTATVTASPTRTATPEPPTATAEPPTATPEPPTATAEPPTAVPPTAVPPQPTARPTLRPTTRPATAVPVATPRPPAPTEDPGIPTIAPPAPPPPTIAP